METENNEVETAPVADTATETMTEEQALASLTSNESEAVEVEETQPQQENNQEGFSLDNIDLSFLGMETTEQTPTTEQSEQLQQEDTVLQQVLEKLNSMTSEQEQRTQLPDGMGAEQAEALTELFSGLKALGLIPENNGLSEEDRQLLNNAKEMQENFNQQKQLQEAQQEHETKLNALDSFSKELEGVIPGYSSETVQQIVASIHKQDPEKAWKIFNNPSLLVQVWNQIGVKSQPQQQPSNVLSTNSSQSSSLSALEEKVNNGTATEAEEAKYLASL